MTCSLFRSLVGLALLGGLALAAAPLHAQTTIMVNVDQAEVEFPAGITFQLTATAGDPITHVSLRYGTNSRTCQTGVARQDLDIEAGTRVDATWEWDFKYTGVVPPGAELWWQWEIETAGGARLLTDRRTLQVEDNDYVWQTTEAGDVAVTWSRGSAAFGQDVLTEATRSLDRLETDLGVRPPGKVQLILYPSAEAVRAALYYVPEWTGGVAYPEYGLTVLAAAPGQDAWLAEVVPHELAHLVVGTLVFNCHGIELPVWLNEGLAVFAEGGPSRADQRAVTQALESSRLPPLRTLAGGFQADPDLATLSYAYSGEVVGYLVETYGPAQLDALLAAMRDGAQIDPALQATYGLDTDSLDAAWRQARGFAPAPARVTSSPTPLGFAAATRTPVPTLALWTAPAPTAASPTAAPTALPAASSTPAPTPVAVLAPTETAAAAAPASPAPAARRPGLACGSTFGLLVFAAAAAATRRARREAR